MKLEDEWLVSDNNDNGNYTGAELEYPSNTGYSTTDGYYGLAESIEISNRKMDKESDAFYAGRNGTSGTRTVGGGSRAATGTAKGSTTNYTQIGELPELTYDTFTAPLRDENRVSSLRMKASGAGLRELRRQTQSIVAGASGLDPTMRRMTLKDALMGYGSGVSKVMSQADQVARRQYEDEYGDKFKESMMNYQAGMNKANLEYKSKIEKLLFNAQHPSNAGSTGYGPILYR